MTARKARPDAWSRLQLLQDLDVGHDLRFDIVRYLYTNGEASPVTMVRSDAIGSASLPLVSYHVRILREGGVVEDVREVPRRGAVEHVVDLSPWAREALDHLVGPDKPINMKPKR